MSRWLLNTLQQYLPVIKTTCWAIVSRSGWVIFQCQDAFDLSFRYNCMLPWFIYLSVRWHGLTVRTASSCRWPYHLLHNVPTSLRCDFEPSSANSLSTVSKVSKYCLNTLNANTVSLDSQLCALGTALRFRRDCSTTHYRRTNGHNTIHARATKSARKTPGYLCRYR